MFSGDSEETLDAYKNCTLIDRWLMSTHPPNEMLILAGGFGTRLRPVVSDVPKPLAPVRDRPFLEYLLDHWIGQGVRRFVLSTGYLGELIQSHFGNDYREAHIEYVHERSPRGTGGALKLAFDEIDWQGEYLLMANGDTWFPVDMTKLCIDAQQQNSTVTLALKSIAKNDRYGGVKVDGSGRISSFGVRSEGSILINAGCYLLNVAELRRALAELPETFSLENDFLAGYTKTGLVGSSIQQAPFLDIGVPEDYRKAIELLR